MAQEDALLMGRVGRIERFKPAPNFLDRGVSISRAQRPSIGVKQRVSFMLCEMRLQVISSIRNESATLCSKTLSILALAGTPQRSAK
jgi:hypothetical protein